MLRLRRLWLFLLLLGMGLWAMPARALQAFPCQCECVFAAGAPRVPPLAAVADAEDEYCVPRQAAPQPSKPCPVVCSQFAQPAHLEKAAPPVQSPEQIEATGLLCIVQLARATEHSGPALRAALPVAWRLPTSPPLSAHHLNLPPPARA